MVRMYIVGVAVITIVIVLAIAVRPAWTEGEGSPPVTTAATSAAREPQKPSQPAPEAAAAAPEGARELRSRMEKDLRVNNVGGFVEALERLLELDPTSADDRDIRAAIIEVLMRIMIGDSPHADKLFSIVEGKMGTAGPDLLFELVTTRGGSRAAKRAEEILRDEAVRSRGTPALRVAYDLRMARGCDEKIALLERAGEEGDRRTLGQLQLLNRSCGRQRGECCLQNDPKLKAALEALKKRYP